MAKKLKLSVNGVVHSVNSEYAPRFGCGLAECGACSVLVDGSETRSCVTPAAAVVGKKVTTVEGLPASWANEKNLNSSEAATTLHPVQQAWIDIQVPQCGYCQPGMMIQTVDLLSTNKNPSTDLIKSALNGHLCRCGTYSSVIKAVQQAAKAMA
jgi:isoquinoline 1-oxidoreductase alpha subunit